MKIREEVVGAKGFEPSTSWSRNSNRNTILLARLALFCVEQAVFGRYLAPIGLKSDSTFVDCYFLLLRATMASWRTYEKKSMLRKLDTINRRHEPLEDTSARQQN